MLDYAFAAEFQCFDTAEHRVKERSHEIFTELREKCPLHRHRMPPEVLERQCASSMVAEPTEAFWPVFRHEDVMRVLQSEEFSSMEGPGPERMDLLDTEGMLMWADTPAHRRQRQIANKAFLPKQVAERVPRIQARSIDSSTSSVRRVRRTSRRTWGFRSPWRC